MQYTVFANRLAKVCDRERQDVWRDGIRLGTGTWYKIPGPAAAELAERKRA